MRLVRSLVLVCGLLAAAAQAAEDAQRDLAGAWLMTVEGSLRSRVLAVSGVAEEGGRVLLDADYGYTIGTPAPLKAELTAGKLVFSTPAESVEAARAADGAFVGTWKPANAAARAVRLERVTSERILERVEAEVAASRKTGYGGEHRDWGVRPLAALRTSAYHAPTPTSIPGARVVTTLELAAMVHFGTRPVLVDVLDTAEGHMTVPGSHWIRDAGFGELTPEQQDRFAGALEALTGGDRDRPIAFYCMSSECWLSYNASLRASSLGYTNVLWYRGGVFAWRLAALEMQPTVPYRW